MLVSNYALKGADIQNTKKPVTIFHTLEKHLVIIIQAVTKTVTVCNMR